MKVCIVGVLPSSLYNFRGGIIRSLISDGHSVFAFSDQHATPEEKVKISSLGVVHEEYRVSRHGMNPFSDFRAFLDILNAFRRISPDVVLTYTIKPNIYGVMASKILGVPHVVSMVEGAGVVYENQEVSSKKLRIAVNMLFRMTLKKSNRTIFLNEDNKKTFIENGIVHKDRSILIRGIGVPLETFQYVPVKPKSRRIRFLFVGRLLNDKGVREFIQAATNVKRKHPDCRFDLLGGYDNTSDSIDYSILENAVSLGYVIHHGYSECVFEHLIDCDVFVLPSYHEGLPRSTMEAMAVGRAVISTNVSGCRETVVEGVNGYLVPARSAESLANAMLRLVDDCDSIVAMGKESRAMAEDLFDEEKINRKMLDVILN